jgi:predicted transcriptional regulator
VSRNLQGRLEFARAVLRELSHGPLSHTDLEKRSRSRGEMSYACFERIFRFLVEDGDVEKCGPEHCAPFRITEKGKAGLAWRAKGASIG